MKHKAFTLGEVLVTMAVVGVLVAITMPMFSNIVPNKEMVMFKKAYYLTSRAVNELINDEDLYPDAERDINGQEVVGFQHTSLRATNTSETEATYRGRTYGGEGTEFPGNQKFCGLFAAKLSIANFNNCTQRVSLNDGGNFTTTDGIIWSMPVSDFSAGPESIFVDVTGSGRNCGDIEDVNNDTCGANKQNIPPDRFEIRVSRDGQITVPNEIAREYLSSPKTNKTFSCIVKEINQKNKKDN